MPIDMLKSRNKSGQAAIVIVVVTMMTVLGIAVATSTRSRINLRDTVYSTQSEQALSCAEAGMDRALVDDRLSSETSITNGEELASSEEAQYKLGGCDGYKVVGYNYPFGSANDLGIPQEVADVSKLSVNEVQQFVIGGDNKVDIKFFALDQSQQADLAVYRYKDGTVLRTAYRCSNNTVEDFDDLIAAPEDLTGDGEDEDVCTVNGLDTTDVSYLRVRALNADLFLRIGDISTPNGYFLVSTGTAGGVKRHIYVYRYFAQLPSAFDEAMVSFSESKNIE